MASKRKKQTPQGDSAFQELSRKFHSNPFVFIGTLVVLLLIVISFVLVPALAPGAGSGSASLNFGTYDGIPIDYIPGNYFSEQRDYFNEQFQSLGQAQDEQYAALQIWRAAFESTVIQTAALQELKELSYSVPAKLVDQRMTGYFMENGRFSAALYRAMPEADRITLRNNLYDQIAMERYMDDVLSLHISSKEKDFILSMASPERSFDLVSFSVLDYPDSEVSAYIRDNPDTFKSIHLSKISIGSSEKDAKKVLDSVTEGTISFEEAARTHSKDEFADKGGDMGVRYVFELTSHIPEESDREALLALGVGDVSGLISVPAGWAFFRVEEAARTAAADDSAVIEKARSYLYSFERGRMEDWAIANAESFARDIQANGLEAAAEQSGKTIQSFGPVPLNYGNTQASYGNVPLFKTLDRFGISALNNAVSNERFWEIAFSTDLNAPSEPLVIADTVMVLVPTSEQSADDSSIFIAQNYYTYKAGQFSEISLKNHILESDKLEDKFFETFIQTFLAD